MSRVKAKPAPEIAPARFFVLRTPILAWDEWAQFGHGLEAPAAADDPARLEAALAADRARLRERLRAVVARPEVREALFVASPSLDQSVPLWLEQPDGERGRKAERALVRYFARMAGRATPFGLFAGCSVGEMAAQTRLAICERARYQRHTRLDMDYLFALTEALNRDSGLRQVLRFFPSSSLYRAAGRLRYAEARLAGGIRSYHLVAVEPSEYLDATLERAQAGARLSELAAALAEQAEVALAEAEEFLGQLVDGQILQSELAPAVTGPEPIHGLIAQLGPHHPAGRALSQARDQLAAIDAAPLGCDPERYRAIARGLAQLEAEAALPRLFQVDLQKPAPGATLGADPLREITNGVALLHRLARPPAGEAFRRFREAFTERYETAEMPLCEVLDEESGIGFAKSNAPGAEASPLLEGLAFPPGPPDETTAWSRREARLLAKLQAATRAHSHEIELQERELELLSNPRPPPLPDSFAVIATLHARSEAALEKGDFRVGLQGASGPSGANLLGRFCHGDQRLTELLSEYLRAEEGLREGAIFAEIVHLPEGRIGNVLLRPLLREHEIVYLGASGAPRQRQIPLGDLMVSVRGERIVLRSRRLGREIIPRLTTAHNYLNPRSLGVYRFLCALQSQGVAGGLGWSWGALESAPFLPRLVAGRLVLARARWRVAREQLKTLGEAPGAAQFRAVQELRRQLELPRWLGVVDSDNVLPIDLDNVLSVETFAHLVKRRREVVLSEMVPGPEELCAIGPEGHFVHELVIPFVRVPRPAQQVPEGVTASPAAPVVRALAPGSEWLYVKLYGGAATLDDVLRQVVAPAVARASAAGAADGWFFIRYGDPEWHLRLRLHGSPDRLHGEVLALVEAAASPLLDDGRLWRIQLDTYRREVERYGGPEGLVLAERVFHADSEAVLAIVKLLSGDEGADARWRLALRGIDLLLDDLGLTLEAKRSLMRQVRQSFGEDFRADVAFERQLGDRFRRERAALEALLSPSAPEQHPLAPGFALLAQRRARWAATMAELRAAEAAGRLTLPLAQLAPSYVHMHANRLLRAAQRAQELVLYDFLARLYDSQLARRRVAKERSAGPEHG